MQDVNGEESGQHEEHGQALLRSRAQAEQADTIMAPAADMFEMGVKVQVLKRGTMFAMRAAKLYELYRTCPSLEEVPAAERTFIEKNLFRAPLEESDFARRGRAHLGDRALANLLTWGYPFIFDDFRFHMTLTGPVPAIERDHVRHVLGHHFGELATAPLVIGQLAVFIEPEPHAPLVVHSVHRLALQESRMIA